jgi:hypothetical protein
MNLFDYIKVIFGKDVDWEKMTNYDKSRNAFMLQRFMSIKYPIQANLFNQLKTDPIGQAESWRMVCSKFNKVPSFIYTKTKKTTSKKEWVPKPKAVEMYLKYNEIGEREFKEALQFNKKEVQIALEYIEKQIADDVDR